MPLDGIELLRPIVEQCGSLQKTSGIVLKFSGSSALKKQNRKLTDMCDATAVIAFLSLWRHAFCHTPSPTILRSFAILHHRLLHYLLHRLPFSILDSLQFACYQASPKGCPPSSSFALWNKPLFMAELLAKLLVLRSKMIEIQSVRASFCFGHSCRWNWFINLSTFISLFKDTRQLPFIYLDSEFQNFALFTGFCHSLSLASLSGGYTQSMHSTARHTHSPCHGRSNGQTYCQFASVCMQFVFLGQLNGWSLIVAIVIKNLKWLANKWNQESSNWCLKRRSLAFVRCCRTAFVAEEDRSDRRRF